MLMIYGCDNFINVCKVLWVCIELGIVFEWQDWGIGFKLISELFFVVMNFNVMVLVIDDDGFVLWEFNSILCYFVG